jgi:hypothetical protein
VEITEFVLLLRQDMVNMHVTGLAGQLEHAEGRENADAAVWLRIGPDVETQLSRPPLRQQRKESSKSNPVGRRLIEKR